jgi:chromosome segregation ATPase
MNPTKQQKKTMKDLLKQREAARAEAEILRTRMDAMVAEKIADLQGALTNARQALESANQTYSNMVAALAGRDRLITEKETTIRDIGVAHKAAIRQRNEANLLNVELETRVANLEKRLQAANPKRLQRRLREKSAKIAELEMYVIGTAKSVSAGLLP